MSIDRKFMELVADVFSTSKYQLYLLYISGESLIFSSCFFFLFSPHISDRCVLLVSGILRGSLSFVLTSHLPTFFFSCFLFATVLFSTSRLLSPSIEPLVDNMGRLSRPPCVMFAVSL